jgi:hypothetical protein
VSITEQPSLVQADDVLAPALAYRRRPFVLQVQPTRWPSSRPRGPQPRLLPELHQEPILRNLNLAEKFSEIFYP